MIVACIVVDRDMPIAVERLVDRPLRIGTDMLVGGGQMEDQRLADRLAFAQLLVASAAVIADAAVSVRPGRSEIGHATATAITEDADLPPGARTRCLDRRFSTHDALVRSESARKFEPS